MRLIGKTFMLGALLAMTGLLACAQQPKKEAPKKTNGNMEWNKLTKEEEDVIVRKGTEYPGTGKLLNNKEKGTYVCRRCNAALYRSDSKFDSHCGWPSFDKAIPGSVDYHEDSSHGMNRTEVTCSKCGGHLGHVFADGPIETTGQRYCINSLAMDFSPLDRAVKPSEPRELE